MSYQEELDNYINTETGLVGITPNDAGYSTGNSLLETGTAYVLLDLLDLESYDDLISNATRVAYNKALDSCLGSDGNFYEKGPKSSPGNISHDDIIGMVAGGVALGGSSRAYILANVILYGRAHMWVFSTSGKLYWDAIAKPWHKAYYILATGNPTPSRVVDNLMLAGYLLVDAYFNKTNASDKRLCWLMVKTCEGKSKVVDFAIKIWNKQLTKVWGSMKNVFKAYFGPDHVFTRYCNE